MFSKEELERYSRHLIIPDFNIEGQRKLKTAKVLVVGCGGLGAPLLSYLVAAGVGTVGIVDYDVVDPSNLHRQVLFTLEDIGKPKAEVAAKRLKLQNPFVQFHTYNRQLTSENALDIIKDYDVVADGTDNFPTRYLVNDACVLLGKVNVYASIYRFEGQLSVFNYPDQHGNFGPNYRDLFPSPPPPHLVPNCAEGGVIGVLPGIMGSLQANEVIKVISGIGDPLTGKLFIFDTLSFENRTLNFRKNPDNPLNGDHPRQKGLIDYEEFCGIKISTKENEEYIHEISAEQLNQMMQKEEDFQLIDVRHPYEYEIANIGGTLIPLPDLEGHLEKISKGKKVVIHCRSGQRSISAIKLLQEKYRYKNLVNLKGGLLSWAEKIDHQMPKY
ncbi:molybdopterin-synthase adenylyltransferase MoeB [Catalinimonas niigatensis]|uniref:molybdopterin-synthase adenylyltransferase MoeB n=1 Tax=Catalinimonas niigatensis TaxID=1397264 RepID=UPI0026666915|nr:molybdopterin-synthase adenylyltransferase MoeB [Catalinimonas niigatensis]WPP51423.1 molybdopterin-synthase adenylyltransferase MoeB [Catalinimonas niigatensis]